MIGITGICVEQHHVSWTLHASDGTRTSQIAYDGYNGAVARALCRDALIGKDDKGWFIDNWADTEMRWAEAHEAARAFTVLFVRTHLPQFFPAVS
ncbi:hypothetical protein ACOI1H_14650 [Loktanella sp. DJP18]|uniref:hypothetical protein n=1 Tax=Loktanella sp. DJP18 TaxID=3409788 RepID=UPI003BB7AAF1